tara:strand:+ start:2083 stop:5055 length:2973 start_codon:yes stop_codon:yes gene_type:complete
MTPEERLTLFDALKTNVFDKPEERLAAFQALENNDQDVDNLLKLVQYNTLTKQTDFKDLINQGTKKDENFDYETGADSGLRSLLSFGETAKDQEAILINLVGMGGYTKDSAGRLALTPAGQRLRGIEPKDNKNLVIEDEGFSFGDIADLTGFVPETVGAISGAIIGLPGFFTSAAGAAAGAAIGQSLEEGVESLLGVQKQTASEVLDDVLTEAALAGGFELAGGIVFRAGRAVIGGTRKIADRAGKLQTVKDDNLARADRLLDEGFLPSAERLGAPGMVAYQQKFAENVMRDSTRIERNIEAALKKAAELRRDHTRGSAAAATEGFENLSKNQFNQLKKTQQAASDSAMKAVSDSINYIQKATKNDATINEQILKSIDNAFQGFEKDIAKDFAEIDKILQSVNIKGRGNAQVAQVIPTGPLKQQFETLIEQAGGLQTAGPSMQQALQAFRELGEHASFRQVVLLRKQFNDALYRESALFQRELGPEINKFIGDLDDLVEGTNLSDLTALKNLTKAQRDALQEASELRKTVMTRYKAQRQMFEDLDTFGVIRSLRNFGKNTEKRKFEIDRFFERVIKQDSPERLKQLFKALGDQEAELLRGELSRTYLEKGLQKTGLNEFGELTSGKFSGSAFNNHIQKLGDTGKQLFGDQWDEVKKLGEIIARSGTDKLDNEIIEQIVRRSTDQNKPLVQALKDVAEAKEAFAKAQEVTIIKKFNEGTLDPIDAVQILATPKRISLNEAKKFMKFFEKDPKALEDIRTFVVEDILSRVDGDVFSSKAAASQLLKHLDSFDDNVLRTILGDDSVTALREFAKDLDFLNDIGREGNVAAAAYTSNPINKYRDIIKFKIFNKIGSDPEVARRYVNMQKNLRRNDANGEAVNDRVASTVENAANKVEGALTTLDNVARVGRQALAQAVGPEDPSLKPRPINTGIGSFNVSPASNVSAIGNIDVTSPGVGAALGLNPTDQAIAARRKPQSPLSANIEQFGEIFNR